MSTSSRLAPSRISSLSLAMAIVWRLIDLRSRYNVPPFGSEGLYAYFISFVIYMYDWMIKSHRARPLWAVSEMVLFDSPVVYGTHKFHHLADKTAFECVEATSTHI